MKSVRNFVPWLLLGAIACSSLLTESLSEANPKLTIDPQTDEAALLQLNLHTRSSPDNLAKPIRSSTVFSRYASLKPIGSTNLPGKTGGAVRRKLETLDQASLPETLAEINQKRPLIIITNTERSRPNASMVLAQGANSSPLDHPAKVVDAAQVQTNTVGNNANPATSTVTSPTNTPAPQPQVIDEWGSMVYTPGMQLPPGVNLVTYDEQTKQFVSANNQAGVTGSAVSPYAVKTEVKPITFQDIDSLVTVANSVWGIYNQYFDLIPDGNQEADKSWADQTLALILLYSKVRNLVLTFVQKRQKLLTEINYLNGKVDQLKATEEDMVHFFALDDQYFRTKLNTLPFMASNTKIKDLWARMDSKRAEFELDLRRAVQGTYDLVRFAQLFEENIREIGRLDYNNAVLNALDKIDDVMMMLVKLVDMRANIEGCITNIKTGLLNLKLHRLEIIEILTSLNQEAELERAASLLTKEPKGALDHMSPALKRLVALALSVALIA